MTSVAKMSFIISRFRREIQPLMARILNAKQKNIDYEKSTIKRCNWRHRRNAVRI